MLQIVEVLLAEPTDDSVEIAVNFVKEVGQLLEVRPLFHFSNPSPTTSTQFRHAAPLYTLLID